MTDADTETRRHRDRSRPDPQRGTLRGSREIRDTGRIKTSIRTAGDSSIILRGDVIGAARLAGTRYASGIIAEDYRNV